MNNQPRHTLRVIQSRRMTLVAATPELIAMDLESRQALAGALGAEVPENWPPDLYESTAMRWSSRQLEDPTELGWSLWYLVSLADDVQQLIGICGFKGKPDATGSVEIGYSVLKQFRDQGFATEAVGRLVRWAFGHQAVKQVTAETLPHLKQSIRVMEKNGLSFSGPGSEHGVIRYVVKKGNL